ncbi:hypothetical protein Q7P35_012586 [Cladosporium inversicolor]
MAGDSVPSKASVISGWTAFSNPAFVKSTLADMHAKAATTTAGESDTNTPVSNVADATTAVLQTNNGNLSDASQSNLEPTQEEKDELLISDPPRLAGEALVDLSRRFSNADIVDLSNAATGGNLTRVAINGRLNTALTKKAKALGTTKALLKGELTEFREARVISSTRREPNPRHSVAGGDTEIGREARRIRSTRRESDHKNSVVGEGTQVDGDERSDVGQAQVPKSEKSDQADKNVQAKSAPQADVATNTHQRKGANTTKETSTTTTEPSAKDAATLAAQKQADHEAFQDQNSLKGEKILLLAERYSNADISAHIRGILGNYPLTENGVATRIHVALEKRAKANGATTQQVRDDLNAARIASGAVKPTPRGRGILRPPKGPKALETVGFAGHSHAAKGPVVAKNGAKKMGAVKHSAGDEGEMGPPKKRAKKTNSATVAKPVAMQVDAEMTEDDSAAGQDSHDSGEVKAGNALLKLADGGPEVREAATILVDMHRGSALADGQSGQSGEVVEDDSELNDF